MSRARTVKCTTSDVKAGDVFELANKHYLVIRANKAAAGKRFFQAKPISQDVPGHLITLFVPDGFPFELVETETA